MPAQLTMLPPLEEIQSSSKSLSEALTILFEHSPILQSTLISQLAGNLPALASYSQLIDLSIAQIDTWDDQLRAQFIAGHPRIGESKNISTLSCKEQGASTQTPPDVLARLEQLNVVYEEKYLGLRYITFVNGRSREAIAKEMEARLGSSPEWKSELDRAVSDIALIAKSRLQAIGVL